jgi:hypothetical protein
LPPTFALLTAPFGYVNAPAPTTNSPATQFTLYESTRFPQATPKCLKVNS